MIFMVFDLPCSSDGKESACNAGDLGSIPGLGKSPGKGNHYPLQYSGLEDSQGQTTLAGYSPWGCKESDMTEQLSLSVWLIRMAYSRENSQEAK